MKFTYEDLMNAMGLQVGDKFEVQYASHTETFTVHRNSYGSIIIREIDDNSEECMGYLLEKDYEILPKPKRVGDLECSGNCKNCSLMSVCSWDSDFQGKKIYEVLDYELTTIHNDKEIYDLLKARLDKEVLDNA